MGYTQRERLDRASAGGVPALQLGDLSAAAAPNSANLPRYPLDGNTDRYLVCAGDVLFRSRGERNIALALDEAFGEPAVAISPIVVIRPRLDVIWPDYLAWAINQPPAQRYFDRTARGTRLRMVPKSSLDELEIDVPDLETQHRIVAIERLAERERALSVLAAEKRRELISLVLVDRARESGHSTGAGGKKRKA
jgi:hypothetical protein